MGFQVLETRSQQILMFCNFTHRRRRRRRLEKKNHFFVLSFIQNHLLHTF